MKLRDNKAISDNLGGGFGKWVRKTTESTSLRKPLRNAAYKRRTKSSYGRKKKGCL